MTAAGATRQRSVYGLLVRLGSCARGASRATVAAEAVRAVAAEFGAPLVSLHPTSDGWAEAVADPQDLLPRLGLLDRARVETLDARLVAKTLERQSRVSALDLDRDLASEEYLTSVLGVSDVFAVPLMAAGAPAGALVVYLDPDSAPPSETDLLALAGVGDVLALAGPPPATLAPRSLSIPAAPMQSAPPAAATPKPTGLLRRLFTR